MNEQAPFTIRPAARSSVKALVGFYGKTGGGKTYSALLFARGLVGPKGRIVMIDTENHRGSYYADLIPGGYAVLDLDAPFSPERYQKAIDAAEGQADVLVIDSGSHVWAGEGGVLDMQEAELARMAGDNYQRRDACKMASWIKPKMEHKQFVNRLLRAKCHVILCLRGEEKTRMDKNDQGKREVKKDDFTTCIADSKLIFEMLINLECYEREGQGGYAHIRKMSHPGTRACLPPEGDQVGIKHGELLAQWCASPAAAPATATAVLPAPTGAATIEDLRKRLRVVTKTVHAPAATPEAKRDLLTGWLRRNSILAPDQTIDSLTAEQLTAAIEKSEIALTP